MKVETKQVLSYFCLRCSKLHYEKDGLFKKHKYYQDGRGVRLRTIQKRTKQTDLVKNFKFPDIPKKLKLGNKVRRVQMKRTTGWKIPSNTIYVGRPSKYGNPFKMIDEAHRESVLMSYRDWLRHKIIDNPHFLDELKSKNLACWCSLNKPCHADILLETMKKLYGD